MVAPIKHNYAKAWWSLSTSLFCGYAKSGWTASNHCHGKCELLLELLGLIRATNTCTPDTWLGPEF